MEEIRKTAQIRMERRQDEVVGWYEPDPGREVVGVLAHRQPLPGGRTEFTQLPALQKKRKTGLWIFLLCVGVLVGGVLAAWFWPWPQIGGMPSGGSSEMHPDGTPDKQPGEDASGNEASGNENPGSDVPGYVIPGYGLPGMGVTFEGVLIPTVSAGDTRLTLSPAPETALTPQEVYVRANPAVVTVMVDCVGGNGSMGTGVIFSPDGYMLTNYHVISGGYRCVVAMADNAQREAYFVAGDATNDIAVMKIEGDNLPWVEMGDSSALIVGDVVYAIGSPMEMELRNTFTNGIVSGLNREVDVDDRSMILLQTNTALNNGNSGGPLINQYGQVVGITTIKMMSDYSTVEGLGFAIPTERLMKLVNELLTQGHVSPEPLMGITVEVLGTLLPDGSVGALVVDVSEGSAAAAAGMKKNDVIVKVGDMSVNGSVEVLVARGHYDIGDRMPVRVWRNGEYLDLMLELLQADE